jgi:hypothetical protein
LVIDDAQPGVAAQLVCAQRNSPPSLKRHW